MVQLFTIIIECLQHFFDILYNAGVKIAIGKNISLDVESLFTRGTQHSAHL